MAVGLFLDTGSWSYCGLRWNQHRKLGMVLEAQGKEEKSLCFSALSLSSLIATSTSYFTDHLGRVTVLEQGRTEEERRTKQWVISVWSL